MQKIKQFIIIALTLIIATPVAVFAIDNPPSISLAVYGDVKIDNNVAPIGTIISVFNNNVEIAQTTVSQTGKYFIEIQAENKGQSLIYKINGVQAMQIICADPLITPVIRLDLVIPVINSDQNQSSGGGYTWQSVPANNILNNIPNNIPTLTLIATSTPALTVAPQVLGVKINADEEQINKILEEAKLVSARNWGSVVRDLALEKNIEKKYLKILIKGLKTDTLTTEQKSALIEFITYGTATTKNLGAGERAGLINSYKSAFNKLPLTKDEWSDAIKIANGRWPNERSAITEARTKVSFKKIYKREAKMDNQYDNASIVIMTYGLRTASRNLASEKAALLSFKHIFKYAPTMASDWDIVRAIAYSGAKR